VDSIHHILQKYWGYEKFRPLQEDIINAILEKKDVLALMPTGGGKSICFQVPALSMEGVCIVITPLIALMRDQVEQLKKRGIKAVSIHSGLNYREIDVLLDNCAYDASIKFLYLSPERLKSDLFLERVKKMKISFLAVDEAHCISQWGYDFRPSYIEISEFRKKVPSLPVLALTATATVDVKKDIQEKLLFKNGVVFTKSFHRSNLSYSCFEEEDKIKKLLEVVKHVPGSSIVYVRNRNHTKELSDYLNKKNIKAAAYHAGMNSVDRNKIQDLWIKNEVRVMVATNAFGMGIDKADVRTVIHITPPESIEAYYQEAGRAGRDELKAYAVLLFTKKELEDFKTRIAQKYPSPELIKKTYQALANYFKVAVGSSFLASYNFNEEEFVKVYKLPKKETFYALKRLESEGYIQLNEGYYQPSKLLISVNNITLYDYQLTHPDANVLIKALLRSYGGDLFNEFVEISEQRIAAQAEMNTSEVRKKLQYLHEINLIVYEPAGSFPKITFTTPRQDAATLFLNSKEMKIRLEKEVEKCNYMIQYATQNRRCRSLVLQEYFDEISDKVCGICDVCLKNKKATDSTTSKELAASIIEQILLGHNTPETLIAHFKPHIKEQFLIELQQLIDREIILIDKSGRLQVKNNSE